MSNYANPVLSTSFPPESRVLADVIPGARVRDALLVLAGAGLTALGAQITFHIPGTPVPVTAQTLAVVLAGSALGTWRGAASQLLYLLLGLALPIYAGGASGGSVLWGPFGGYIFGFVLAAGLVGWASEHGADRRLALAALMFALGQLAIYGIGVPWLKVSEGFSWGTAIHEGFTIFIVTGLIKAVVGGVCMPTAWRIERRLSQS
ncbi:MAG TPA: biotin transporter BioY [Solirubrobacteraceae bacterium]|nr:biotin transporter BioY [Solirubrobacteraceae bacterium]